MSVKSALRQRRTRARIGTYLISGVCLLLGSCAQTPLPQQDNAGPSISEYLRDPAVLVFSKTAGWRHNEGIAGADAAFAAIAGERALGLFTTENAAVFNDAQLSRFSLIVFNNVTGDALSRKEQAAFERWMLQGGAWIGLHGSGDSSLQPWDWYQRHLIGTRFVGHTMDPQIQTATMVTLAGKHPVMDGLPSRWSHRDEWYSFDAPPTLPGMTLLVGIDESSYVPLNTIVERWPRDLRMSATPSGHPMVWAVCEGNYRGVYSAIGHQHTSYADTNYLRLLGNAVDWVLRRTGSDDCS
ncbi:MAG: ThuA domain-containing protein [Pseudomonadota bacterium]